MQGNPPNLNPDTGNFKPTKLSKMKKTKKTPKPVSVSVERAELRNGKIIVVIKPDLLSGQEFAVSACYNEGKEKNMLQKTRFSISVIEEGGKIMECRANYGESHHYTTGNIQIRSMKNVFINQFDKCLHEIQTMPIHYLNVPDRLQQIFDNHTWSDNALRALKNAVHKRLIDDREKRLREATENLISAQKQLQVVVEEQVQASY